MRARTILLVGMVVGTLCLPALAARRFQPQLISVRLDGDANDAVATRVGVDANAARAVVMARRGYVGVQLSPVPAAVASQLRLKNKGVMIRNVAKGSPADKAGLDRYDVIVVMDKGKPVESMSRFIMDVRKKKPGETLSLSVLRGGEKRVFEVTLGKRPAGEIEYVYEEDPDDHVNNEFSIRRGMLHKKDGKWVFETFEGKPSELPRQIRDAVRGKPWNNIRVQTKAVGDANTACQISVTTVSNGRKLSITGGADGKIKVTRTTIGGKTETTRYDSVDELKKADKEAFELYRSVRQGNVRMSPGGLGSLILQSVKPMVGDGKDVKAAAEDVQKAAEKLQREIDQHVRELTDKTRREAFGARDAIAQAIAPVSRQFDVDESGRIQVHIVKGVNELNMTFASQAEMKAKNPRLHAEYEKLLDSRTGDR